MKRAMFYMMKCNNGCINTLGCNLKCVKIASYNFFVLVRMTRVN